MSKTQTHQMVNEAALLPLGTPARATVKDIVASASKCADAPMRMYAAQTPDAKLYFASNRVEAGNGSARVKGPIEDLTPVVPASSINFSTAATTGATFLVEGAALSLPGAVGFPSNPFIRFAFALRSTGEINIKYSAQAASVAALQEAGAMFAGLDGDPIGWVDMEYATSSTLKTAGSASAIIENKVSTESRIFNFPSGSGGAGGGVSDFKLQTISANLATIKKGTLQLDDGTYLHLATDLTFDLKTAVNTAGVVAPANSTRYHLYIDREALPAATTVGTTDRQVKVPASGTSGAFVVFANGPESGLVNLFRYVPIADLKTNGSGDYTAWITDPVRRHNNNAAILLPLTQTIGPTAIGTVGAASNLAGGHVLDLDSFRAGYSTSLLSFYNMLSASDAYGGRNLTNNGTVPFTATGIRGLANTAADFNGTTHSLSSTDAFFNPGDADHSFACWARLDDATPAANAAIAANDAASGTDRGWTIESRTDSKINFEIPTAASTSQNNLFFHGKNDGEWVHVAFTYNATTNLWSFYLDGQYVGSMTQAMRTVTASIFRLGARRSTAIDFFDGAIDEVMFDKRCYTAQEIAKLASVRLDLTDATLDPANQLWTASSLGSLEKQENSGDWMIEKKRGKVYVRPSGLSTDQWTFKQFDIGMSVRTIPVRAFRARYTSDPTGTIAHGLQEMPTAITILHDAGANGRFMPRNAEGLIDADATNLYVDLSQLTIDASHPVIIVAGSAPVSAGITQATHAAQGLVTSHTPVIASSILAVASADHSPVAGDGKRTFLYTTGASDRTHTLPDPALNVGRVMEIVKVDAGAGHVIIAGTISADYTDFKIRQLNGHATLMSTGTAWVFVVDITENGLFTPNIQTTGTVFSSVTYVTQVGFYNRTGANLTYSLNVTWSAASGGTANLKIQGLPIPATSNWTHRPIFQTTNLDYPAGGTVCGGAGISNNATEFGLVVVGDNFTQDQILASAATGGTFSKAISGCTSYRII